MEADKVKLYFILLRLKSYLVSLIDNPEECSDDFVYTEEYLNRRFPERLEEIIDTLKKFDINCDCDIAFDQNIQVKFKAIVEKENSKIDLETLLNNSEIQPPELLIKEKQLDKFKKEREEKIKAILTSLFQLSKIWVAHKNLQTDIDDYSVLDEEEILRPEEIEELKRLDVDTALSFDVISKLTQTYLNELSDFYFQFGGNINLHGLINDLAKLKIDVEKKYDKLFREHGLDPGKIDNNQT